MPPNMLEENTRESFYNLELEIFQMMSQNREGITENIKLH